MKKTIKILIWIVLVAGAVSVAEFFYFKESASQPAPQPQKNISSNQQASATIPYSVNMPESPSAQSAVAPDQPAVPSDPIPAKFILPIPFYSQAPLGKWDAVHEEMCEESSVLNAGLHLLNKKMTTDTFEKELMAFKKIEEKKLGNYKSNTIAEIKKAADIYFAGKISLKIINNPTIEDIETEIAAGNPVIVPLAGREIGNPNFTPPGPVYHMLVIKGYDAQNFITNDVGTRKGDSYVYKKAIIMDKMHDWNPQDIHLGAKKALILSK